MTRNLNRILAIVLSVFALFVMASQTNTNASACNTNRIYTKRAIHRIKKSNWTLDIVPKSLRGTWYQYNPNHAYTIIRFDRHGYDDIFYNKAHRNYHGYYSSLHRENLSSNKMPKMTRKEQNWFCAMKESYKHHNWFCTDGWYGAGGDEYRTAHHDQKLIRTSGAGFWSDGNFYRTKKLARIN